MGYYKFNGTDVNTAYGIVFRPGTYSELLKLPKRKEGLTVNWAGENGTERYLGAVRYETITYSLPILIMAGSEATFWARYNALRDFLITSGLFNFDVEDLNRRFRVSFADMTNFKTLTRIKGSNQIAAEGVLQLYNDYPTEFLPIP